MKKKYIAFLSLLLLFSAFALSGCKDEPEDNTQVPAVTDENTTEEDGEELNIYGINDTTLESEPISINVKEEEITAEIIVQAVVDDFKAHSLNIGIDCVTEDGNTVIVSFLYGTPPLAEVGSDVEETILNCIADSLLDNLDSCSAVIYQAEGGDYESGHFGYAKDEIYASE